jgi:hypothetical protein
LCPFSDYLACLKRCNIQFSMVRILFYHVEQLLTNYDMKSSQMILSKLICINSGERNGWILNIRLSSPFYCVLETFITKSFTHFLRIIMACYLSTQVSNFINIGTELSVLHGLWKTCLNISNKKIGGSYNYLTNYVTLLDRQEDPKKVVLKNSSWHRPNFHTSKKRKI